MDARLRGDVRRKALEPRRLPGGEDRLGRRLNIALFAAGWLLAQVLGAEVRRLPAPEVGWFPVETDDPDRVPPGPWLLWHEDEFTAPPGAEVVARTEVSLQAFVHGRHTGIQFHPEVTRDVVGRWVLEARDEGSIDPVRAARVMDGFGPRDQGRRHEADRLFDRFAEQAGTAPEKGPGP